MPVKRECILFRQFQGIEHTGLIGLIPALTDRPVYREKVCTTVVNHKDRWKQKPTVWRRSRSDKINTSVVGDERKLN